MARLGPVENFQEKEEIKLGGQEIEEIGFECPEAIKEEGIENKDRNGEKEAIKKKVVIKRRRNYTKGQDKISMENALQEYEDS